MVGDEATSNYPNKNHEKIGTGADGIPTYIIGAMNTLNTSGEQQIPNDFSIAGVEQYSPIPPEQIKDKVETLGRKVKELLTNMIRLSQEFETATEKISIAELKKKVAEQAKSFVQIYEILFELESLLFDIDQLFDQQPELYDSLVDLENSVLDLIRDIESVVNPIQAALQMAQVNDRIINTLAHQLGFIDFDTYYDREEKIVSEAQFDLETFVTEENKKPKSKPISQYKTPEFVADLINSKNLPEQLSAQAEDQVEKVKLLTRIIRATKDSLNLLLSAVAVSIVMSAFGAGGISAAQEPEGKQLTRSEIENLINKLDEINNELNEQNLNGSLGIVTEISAQAKELLATSLEGDFDAQRQAFIDQAIILGLSSNAAEIIADKAMGLEFANDPEIADEWLEKYKRESLAATDPISDGVEFDMGPVTNPRPPYHSELTSIFTGEKTKASEQEQTISKFPLITIDSYELSADTIAQTEQANIDISFTNDIPNEGELRQISMDTAMAISIGLPREANYAFNQFMQWGGENFQPSVFVEIGDNGEILINTLSITVLEDIKTGEINFTRGSIITFRSDGSAIWLNKSLNIDSSIVEIRKLDDDDIKAIAQFELVNAEQLQPGQKIIWEIVPSGEMADIATLITNSGAIGSAKYHPLQNTEGADGPTLSPTPTGEAPKVFLRARVAEAPGVASPSTTEIHYAGRMAEKLGVKFTYNPDILGYTTIVDGKELVLRNTEDQPLYEQVAYSEDPNTGTWVQYEKGVGPDPRGNLWENPNPAANYAAFVAHNWPNLASYGFIFSHYTAADVTNGNNIPEGATEIDRYLLDNLAFEVEIVNTPEGKVFIITMNTNMSRSFNEQEALSWDAQYYINLILAEINQNVTREKSGQSTNWSISLNSRENGESDVLALGRNASMNISQFFFPSGNRDFSKMWLTSESSVAMAQNN